MRYFRFCRLAQNGKKFVDDSFPANDRSLFFRDRKRDSVVSSWMRPSEIDDLRKDSKWILSAEDDDQYDAKLSWTVFNDTSPSDIKQGSLGNCWSVFDVVPLQGILQEPCVSALCGDLNNVKNLNAKNITNVISMKHCKIGYHKRVISYIFN